MTALFGETPDVAGPSASCPTCGFTITAKPAADPDVRYTIASRCDCGTVVEVWPAPK